MMRKERLTNVILLVTCGLLYVFARVFRASYKGESFVFLRYHFTDLIAPVLVLAYSGLLLNTKKRHSIKKFLLIVALCTFCSFVWEYCAQFIRPGSTADWVDVYSVFSGGIIYWIIINLVTEGNQNG